MGKEDQKEVWKCLYCDKKFKTCEFLSKHMIAKHEDIKFKVTLPLLRKYKPSWNGSTCKTPSKSPLLPSQTATRATRGPSTRTTGEKGDASTEISTSPSPRSRFVLLGRGAGR